MTEHRLNIALSIDLDIVGALKLYYNGNVEPCYKMFRKMFLLDWDPSNQQLKKNLLITAILLIILFNTSILMPYTLQEKGFIILFFKNQQLFQHFLVILGL